MTLGQRISQYRKQLGISQEMLGERLGVSRQAVSKWETDAASPDMENLLALARVFDISLAELTETPSPLDAPSEASVPPFPHAESVTDSGNAQSHRKLLSVFLAMLIGILAVLVLRSFRTAHTSNAGTAGAPPALEATMPETPVQKILAPETDFALILDWTETGEFLELGEQIGDYPFGTSLYLSGGETVVKGDNGEEVHTVGSLEDDAFRLRYSYLEDDGLPARNVITLLEVVRTKEVSTPRGIHIGSTKADVVGTYSPDALIYCLKDEGSDLLCQHDYYYAYQPKDAYSNSLCFFMEDGLVAGIRVENMMDLGNEAYAVNNMTRFPVQKNGDPDYSNRQDLYQEPVSPTRQVYIAWNRLVTGENLSAEERYVCRSQVFTNLSDMDWQEFGKLGTTDAFATSESFAQWLQEQTFSDSELFWVQVGLNASGLDGAYAENYTSLLAAALFQNPVGYAKQLPRAAEYDEMVKQRLLGSTAYGADYYTAECASALETLDAVIDTSALTASENDWAKLLRYYLTNSNNGNYADYPKTPAALQ